MKLMYPNSPTSAEKPVLPGGFLPLVGQSIERVGMCAKNPGFSSIKANGMTGQVPAPHPVPKANHSLYEFLYKSHL